MERELIRTEVQHDEKSAERKVAGEYRSPQLVQVGTLSSIQGHSGRKGDHDVGSAYAMYLA
jgi:hypothetical protein